MDNVSYSIFLTELTRIFKITPFPKDKYILLKLYTAVHISLRSIMINISINQNNNNNDNNTNNENNNNNNNKIVSDMTFITLLNFLCV